MFRNPMSAILSFAENRGKDEQILTNRLNQVFGPMTEQLMPASADGGFSMGEPVAPPQPAMAPPPMTTAQRSATMQGAVDPSQMMILGEVNRGGEDMFMLRSPDGEVSYQPRAAFPGAEVGQSVSAAGEMSGGLPPVGDFTPPAFVGTDAGGMESADQVYRDLGSALGVTTSTSGSVSPEQRRTIESDIGAILNEVYDPESQIEANKRQGVADLFTGLGIGFGQMSRGDRVDLSEVRTAAAQRQREQTALRMERAKRAAGASYAMELGDEGLARAIAGGAADVNTLLTKRQQDIVNDRADAGILRQSQQDNMLANVLVEDGSFSPEMVEAIRAGADPNTIMKVADRRRAADLAVEAQERAESQIEALRAMQARAAEPSAALESSMAPVDPIIDRAMMLAEVDGYRKIYEGGTLYDYMSEARQQSGEMRQQAASGSDPAAQQTNLLGAQTAMSDPNAPEATRAAASLVQQSGGALSMAEAAQQVTAGGGFAQPEGPSAEVRSDNLLGALTALQDETAPDAARAAARLVQESQGRLSMSEAATQVTAGGAFGDDPQTRVREENIATNAAAFEAQNVPPEMALELATGMETGRFVTLPHPETGRPGVYDKTAMILGAEPEDAQLFPPPAAPSTYDPPPVLPEGADYAGAFGVEGAYKQTLNNVGELLGLGLLDRPNREAVTAVRRLAQNGKIAAAVEVGGRPSAFLLQLYESLETQPARLFTGADTAEIQLQEQREAVVRDLQELDQILQPNAPFRPQTREEAMLRRNRQRAHLADLDVVLSGIQRGRIQATDDTPAPEGRLRWNPQTQTLEPVE